MFAEMLSYLNILSFKIAPLFYKLLFMSIGAIIVGSIILLIRRFADNKISPVWKYLMWMLVIIALIVPYRPTSNYSAIGDTSNIENVSFREEYDNISYKVFLADQDQNVSNEEVNKLAKKQESLFTKSFIFDFAIPLVWFFVMMLFIVFLVISKLLLMKNINSNLLPVNEDYDRTNKIFIHCKEKLNVKSDIRLVVQSKYNFPAITGVTNPIVILPNYVNEMSDESVANVIYHELSHYKRGDMYVNGALLILQAIYWFNPLVWLLFKYIREDMEVLTDSYVINNIDSLNSKCYLSSLVEVLGRANSVKMMPRMLCMVDGKKNTKRRIEMIKLGEKFKKKRIIISVVSIVIVVVLSVLFLTRANHHDIKLYLFNDYNIVSRLNTDRASLDAVEATINSDEIEGYNKDGNMLFLNREIPYDDYKAFVITVDGKVITKGSSDYINISVDGITIEFSSEEDEEIFETVISEMKLNTDKVFGIDVLDGNHNRLYIKKLWEKRVYDININEALDSLVSSLIFPNKVEYKSCKVDKDGDKNTLIVNLTTRPEILIYYSKESNQENFKQNSSILFSLIKDIDSVEFVLNEDSKIKYANKITSPESLDDFYKTIFEEYTKIRKNNYLDQSGLVMYVWENDSGDMTYSMLWGIKNKHSKSEIYDEKRYTTDINDVKTSLKEYKKDVMLKIVQMENSKYSESELLGIASSIGEDKNLKIKNITVDTTKVKLDEKE